MYETDGLELEIKEVEMYLNKNPCKIRMRIQFHLASLLSPVRLAGWLAGWLVQAHRCKLQSGER